MRENISELIRTPGARKVVQIDEMLPPESEIELASPVKGQITLTNTGTVLLVTGKVRAEVVQHCSRCLDELKVSVEAEIQEEFRLNPGAGPEGQTTVDSEYEEDISSILISDTEIDLGELIRQSLLVSMPLQPLCNEACKGLCPQCGKNRNREECDCGEDISESPFAKLASLLEYENNES